MIRVYGAPTTEDALTQLAACVSANEERGERTLVFCEDSLTLLAERAALGGREATFLTDVTTFARFLKGDRQVLSKQGSVAAVSSILSACRDRLVCFSENAAGAVYETIAQLAASRVGEEELLRGAQASEGMLRGKLTDLALILSEYRAFLREKGLLDENGYLALLPDQLAGRGLGETNVIFFGFASFTKQGAEGIRAAALNAKSLTGIFPAGGESYYTNESVKTFRSACADVDKVSFVGIKSSLTGEAETLRRRLFSPEIYLDKPARAEHVFLFRARDEADEARTVCAHIKQAFAEGLRCRDIAVLVPDASFSVMEKAFVAYGIPYFADVKRPFSRHPFCAFVQAVLRAVSDGGTPASADDVAANVCFGESAQYRNYLAKFGGWRGAYRKEIRRDAAGFGPAPALEACRSRMIGVLSRLPRSGTGSAFAGGIRDLAKFVDAEGTCSRLAASFTDAERDFLSLDPLEGILSEIETVAGGRTFTAREFSALFAGAADALKRSMIPVLSDAVFLGDATQSRFGRVRRLFVTGATDALPATGQDNAVITDREIEKLGAQGVDIQPAIAVVNARAREGLALNVCSFSEQLYVSCPVTLKAQTTTAGELFTSCAAVFSSAPVSDGFPYTCSERVPAYLCLLEERAAFEEGRTHDARRFASVWAALAQHGEGERLNAVTEEEGKADIAALPALLPPEVSPTLLENYFECPYRAFLTNLLRLKEREEATALLRDSGSFVHRVLEKMGDAFNTLPSEEACAARAREAAQALLDDTKERFTLFGETSAGTYGRGRLLDECEKVAVAAYRSLHDTSFRIAATERAVSLPGLQLRGKVDRLDESEGYVRIIDYKTGSIDAGAVAYYTGRKLQLELYLTAAAAADGEAKPAGAFYFPALDKFTKPEEGKFLMEGFYDKDAPVFATRSGTPVNEAGGGMASADFADFLTYASLVSARAQEELRAGNIAPSPYEGACKYCKYRGACGYTGEERREEKISEGGIAQIVRREEQA